ncbi:MAG: BTAD domain-containing putative transcriptional regulator [Nisaea sp.]|uniref:BTAD domain-containing putative transcriptional regulator n=1 Tax=Nisaea sp. TaxID=2024842 RepID=UPI00329A0C95
MVDSSYNLTEHPNPVGTASAYPKAGPQSALIKISLLGGFLIEAPSGTVDLLSRKAQAILAYLILLPSQKATRESIAGLLWSNATEGHARASLRQALRRLNQYFDAIGIVGIDATRNEIRLNNKVFETDLWAILENDTDAPVHPTLLERSDISASLLLGFEDLDEVFYSWVLTQRQNLNDRLVASLELRLAQRSKREGHDAAHSTKNAALALANLDPTHEGACRELMLQHVRAGDIGSALKRYNRLWSLLENDYDMEPSDETKALVALIKTGADEADEEPGSRSSRPDPSGTPRLVVEPFSFGGVPDPLKFMARAFRHQFMSSLLKFREWLVVDGEYIERQKIVLPTNPVFRISGDTYVKDTILYVVISVRDFSNDTLLWSEENPASLDTWPRTLRQLVQKLAIAINTHAASNRQITKREEPNQSHPVYDRWMQGRRLNHLWTPTGWAEAEEIFTSVRNDQPDFAPGHSSLSFCASLKRFVYPGFRDEPGLSLLAIEHAKRSIELGPRDAKGYQASGWAHILVGEFERAAVCFGIAETVNENDIGVAASAALGLAYCGDSEEALRRLDHLHESGFVYQSIHWSFEAACRFICRDYPGTLWAAAKANEGAFYPQAWSAAAFAQLGDDRAAEREARKFLVAARENWVGEMPPLPSDISRWFLSVQPFRNPADYFHMKHSLERAGLTTR